MQRHFSVQRLLVVVVWAALSPQGALLVQSWTTRLLSASGFDTASVSGDFDSGWNQWSDRLDTVLKNTPFKNTAASGSAGSVARVKETAGDHRVPQNPVGETAVAQDAATVPNRIQPAPASRPLAEQTSARGEYHPVVDLASGQILCTLSIGAHRDQNLPVVVIR